MRFSYSSFGRELLVIYLAIRQFCHWLEDPDFVIYNDCVSVSSAPLYKAKRYTPREISYPNFISQFTNHFSFICDEAKILADTSSHTGVKALFIQNHFNPRDIAGVTPNIGSSKSEETNSLSLQLMANSESTTQSSARSLQAI